MSQILKINMDKYAQGKCIIADFQFVTANQNIDYA